MNGHSTHSSISGSDEITVNVRKIDTLSNANLYSGREGQVACSILHKVYIFGGVEQGHGDQPKETNELIVFDLDTLKWAQVNAKGTVPPPRSASSLVGVGTKLYLFGGLSHISGWFDDLFMFDTESNTWTPLETEGPRPKARDKLQAVAVGEKIYYFGGFGPKTIEAEIDDLEGTDDEDEEFEDIPESRDQEGAEFGWFNDLFVLDTQTLTWSQPMQMNLGVPTQRAAHGMCAVGRNLIIFGGRDIEDRQNDIHIFDTDTRKWLTDMKVEGPVPAPRSFHSLTSVAGKAVLFGGRGRDNHHFDTFDVFDIETKKWTPVQVTGDKLAGRGQQCAVSVGDSLFLLGGSGDYSAETMQCQTFFTDAFLVKADDFVKGSAGSGDV
ncbi:kelch domain-containing protein 1 [Plakobranchus ocellatus]|uniref:Kelch domain-containing protein 1 n=1 Tax=Plakobranchus ocellatus TaxID=259542 RepID=A0AAV4D197_9GAST|nr:kelch domain-containing protein 1 [Plakobranchus ocellatus]